MIDHARRWACGVVCGVVLTLGACGGDEGAVDPGGRPGASTSAKDAGRRNPLETLTPERLDEYVSILEAAAADPIQDEVDVATKRGWKIREWVNLHATVRAVMKDDGFDAWLERIRNKIVDVDRTLAGYEEQLSNASDDERHRLEGGFEVLQKTRAGWARTLESADAMRPGGVLVEGRLADIRAALGK